jgi:NAD(P)-dependent dehydrogenase (short-subunit alcohol dehydrogenase family)
MHGRTYIEGHLSGGPGARGTREESPMPFDPNDVPAMPGRIAIVTGANTGLGFETALVFARKGIKTIMACRSEEKALEAKARIAKQVPGADLVVMQLDLADLDNVRSFARRFKDAYDQLDLLVLNAGIMMPPYAKTKDGFESQMAANYLGHFLLTSLLIDLMPDTSASRVVALSSNAHKMGTKQIQFDDLQWEKKYSAIAAYAQTKLACLMFSNTLARRLEQHGKQIVAAAAHPGASMTDLSRHNPVLAGVFRFTLAPFFAQSSRDGARPQLQAALDPDVKGGDYYGPTGLSELKGPSGPAKQLPYALDEGHQDQLWAISEKLTGAVFPWEAAGDNKASRVAA